MRSALFVALLSIAALAGCSAPPAADEPLAPAPEPAPFVEPETLYLLYSIDGHGFTDEAPSQEMGSGGLAVGCDGSSMTQELTDPCWDDRHEGIVFANHSAGDGVQVFVWLQAKRPQGEITLEAWLSDVEGELARGTAVGTAGLSPPTGGGAMGCTQFRIDLVLARDLPAEQTVVLDLQAPHHFGSHCWGGGEDAGRIIIGDPPGSPS